MLLNSVAICILTCKLFSSTIDHRQRVQHFPQDLNRVLPFNPLDCFAIHFEAILIRFLLHCGLLVSCLSHIGEDSSLADGSVETFE